MNLVKSRPKVKPSGLLLKIVIVGLVILFVFYIDDFIMSRTDAADSDFSWFWTAGYAVTHGQNPYNHAQTAAIFQQIGHTRIDPDLAFAYPIWTVILFVPFGLLPYSLAVSLWALFNQVLFLLTFVMFKAALRLQHSFTTSQARQWHQYLLYFGLIPFMLTPHFIHSLLNGQTSFFMTWLLALFALCLARAEAVPQPDRPNKPFDFLARQKWSIGAGLGLVAWLCKPPLVLVLLPVILLWLYTRKAWIILMTAVVGTLVLGGFSLLIYAGWIAGWLNSRASEGYAALTNSSNLIGLVNAVSQNWGLAGLALPLAVLIGVVLLFTNWLVLRRQSNPILIFGLICSLALATTPYAHNYDELALFLPALALLDWAWALPLLQRWLVWVNLALMVIIVPWLLNVQALNSPVAGFYALSVNIFGLVVVTTTNRPAKRTVVQPGAANAS